MLTRPGRAAVADRGRPGAARSWCSTSCTPTAAGRAPTSRCWSAGCARRAERRALQCIGTSATMSSEGTLDERRQVVAEVATQLFGTEVTPGERHRRDPGPRHRTTRRRRPSAERVAAGDRGAPTAPTPSWSTDPLAALDRDALRARREETDGRLVRRRPDHRRAGRGRAGRGQRASPRTAAQRRSATTLQAGSRGAAPGHRPAAVRVPAAPVPLQGRHRLRHPRDRGRPAHHPQLPASVPGAAGRRSCCRSPSAASAARSTSGVARRRATARSSTSPGATPTPAAATTGDGYLYVDRERPWPDDRRGGIEAAAAGSGWRPTTHGERGRPRLVPQAAADARSRSDPYGPRRPGDGCGRGSSPRRSVLPALRGRLRAGARAGTSPSWPPSTRRAARSATSLVLGVHRRARCERADGARSTRRHASC